MTKSNEFFRPQLNILNQYIKDLSYENPQSINQILSNNKTSDVLLDMNAFYQSFDNDCFGITLKIVCHSIFDKNKLFYLELDFLNMQHLKHLHYQEQLAE